MADGVRPIACSTTPTAIFHCIFVTRSSILLPKCTHARHVNDVRNLKIYKEIIITIYVYIMVHVHLALKMGLRLFLPLAEKSPFSVAGFGRC